MKTFFAIVCVAATVAAFIYLNGQKTSSTLVPQQMVESSAQQTQPDKIIAPKPESRNMVSKNTDTVSDDTNAMAQVPATNSIVENSKPDDSTNSIRQLVDTMLATKTDKKEGMFAQLRKAGQLDAVIAELKQRAADNPNDAEILATIGEAQFTKLRAMGPSIDSDAMEILALQADQSFEDALKIDPSNWEAQFVRALSRYHWPANPQSDNETVQQLSSLIDQQETMALQPLFPNTYVLLGQEYLKNGQPDYAAATWQLGLDKYPNNPQLQERVANPPKKSQEDR